MTTTSRSWRRWPPISWRSELRTSDPRAKAHCCSGFAGEHSDGITKGYWDKTLEMGRTSSSKSGALARTTNLDIYSRRRPRHPYLCVVSSPYPRYGRTTDIHAHTQATSHGSSLLHHSSTRSPSRPCSTPMRVAACPR
jgi:hypothetical protein